MREWIKGILTPPTFAGDTEKTLVAQKVHLFLLFNFFGMLLTIIVEIFAAPERLIRIAPILPIIVFLLFMNHRGWGKAAALYLIASLWLVITFGSAISG